jgi:hypothetical protein
MALAGLRVTVVPHFDNGEGGRTHDTSRCFIGERRLRLLEGRLPDGTGVLGVDEYTAAVFDLAADTLSVLGRGGVTLRRGPVERRWESGQEVGLGELREPGEGGDRGQAPPSGAAGGSPDGGLARLDDVSAAFERALADGDVQAMVAAIMGASRLAATPGPGGEAQLALGGMVARLGELAVEGLRDPAELLAPLVGPLLRLRTELRQAGRYELADTVRGVLTGAGVEVRDTPDGTAWRLDSGVESADGRRPTDADRPDRSGRSG